MDSSLKAQEPQLVDTPEIAPSLKAQEPQLVDTPVIVPSPVAEEPDNDVPAPGNEFAEFAAGCFWGVELVFQRIPGVTVTEVGYTQGISHNPSYEDVCTNTTNHAEVVRVQYDPKECTYETLLDLFWSRHDPTTLNRQHPQFFSNPFYATGDSYAGMIIPALVQESQKGIIYCCNPPINLQGYVLGNPVTHIEIEQNYRIPFAHGMSLISDELYKSLKTICKGNYFNVDPRNTKCLKHVKEYHKCIDKINIHHILIPDCDDPNTQLISPDCFYYRYHLLERWANKESVRKALQINKGSIGEWLRCNRTIPYNKNIKSSVPYHINNSINGYRSLIFSGDHDLVLPSFATQAWIKSLNYSITHEWKPWMIKDQIAGFG